MPGAQDIGAVHGAVANLYDFLLSRARLRGVKGIFLQGHRPWLQALAIVLPSYDYRARPAQAACAALRSSCTGGIIEGSSSGASRSARLRSSREGLLVYL